MKQTQGKFILLDLTEFGAWLNSTTISREILRIQNHHTWNPSYSSFTKTNHFTLLEGMEHAHIERGFTEIGQNFTTFPDGTIAVCRALDKIPAGIKGANTGGICIEHVGNFDTGYDLLNNEQKTTIISINALLCKKFNLTPNSNTIVYHHWYDLTTGERKNGAGTTKTCPGSAFFGGNMVADAEANFIPLITTELNTISHITPVTVAEILFKAKVMSDNLNVRMTPDANSKHISELKKGVIVNAYETNGNWCRIHPQESYWANSTYLQKIT